MHTFIVTTFIQDELNRNQTYLVELIYFSIFLPSSLVTKVAGITKVKPISVGSSSDMIVPMPPRSLMLKS